MDALDEGFSSASKEDNLLLCLHVEETIDTVQNLAQCANSVESNHGVDATTCSESDAALHALEIIDESLENTIKLNSYLLKFSHCDNLNHIEINSDSIKVIEKAI